MSSLACFCFLYFCCSFYYNNYNSQSGNPAWPPPPVSANYNSNAWNNTSPVNAWQHTSPNSVRNLQTTSPTASNSSWNAPPPVTVASSNSMWTPPTPPSYNHDRLPEEYDSYSESLSHRQTYHNYSMSYDRYLLCFSFNLRGSWWLSGKVLDFNLKQGSHRLVKYLNLEGYLEKSLN